MNGQDSVYRSYDPALFVFDLKGRFHQRFSLSNHSSSEWLALGISQRLSKEATILLILHTSLEESPRLLRVPVQIFDKRFPEWTEGCSPELEFQIENGIDKTFHKGNSRRWEQVKDVEDRRHYLHLWILLDQS